MLRTDTAAAEMSDKMVRPFLFLMAGYPEQRIGIRHFHERSAAILTSGCLNRGQVPTGLAHQMAGSNYTWHLAFGLLLLVSVSCSSH